MRAIILGAGGQVGRALCARAPAGCAVDAFDRAALDLTDHAAIRATVRDARPDVVVNASAYTAVDRAESERGKAFAVNADAVEQLAAACDEVRCRLVHISTDFVFNGAASRPYLPNDATAPLGVYGESKLAGEAKAGPNALVVRTAWVYDSGVGNFPATMLRLMREREEVGVVADQVGTPTYAADLADALWTLAATSIAGTLHFTNSGVASWYDFAVAIAEEAVAVGILPRAPIVRPIATGDYPTPARRPSYSVLDCRDTTHLIGRPARHWRAALRDMLKEKR